MSIVCTPQKMYLSTSGWSRRHCRLRYSYKKRTHVKQKHSCVSYMQHLPGGSVDILCHVLVSQHTLPTVTAEVCRVLLSLVQSQEPAWLSCLDDRTSSLLHNSQRVVKARLEDFHGNRELQTHGHEWVAWVSTFPQRK